MFKSDKCSVCGQMSKRTKMQNNLLWAIMRMIEEQLAVKGKHFGADCWLEYFKERYLGKEEFPLPNGKIITRTRGTSSLTKEEMSEFMLKIESWCGQHGVQLPDFDEGNI